MSGEAQVTSPHLQLPGLVGDDSTPQGHQPQERVGLRLLGHDPSIWRCVCVCACVLLALWCIYVCADAVSPGSPDAHADDVDEAEDAEDDTDGGGKLTHWSSTFPAG